MKTPVLSFTQNGIYCAAGDFYIDPQRPVPRAVITHGHSDHARSGHKTYLTTDAAAPIIKHRLGKITHQTQKFGQVSSVGNARVSFHPAGHIPGSAQVRVEVGGEVWVVSGDYKLGNDGLSETFEPVKCHSFITECTFGLPIFRWKPHVEISNEINTWWAQNASVGRVSILGAYSLGKAQRLLAMLDPSIGPILTHGAVEATNAILRSQGYDLPDTELVDDSHSEKTHSTALVVAPPSAMRSEWAARFGPAATGFASGWMQMRNGFGRRTFDQGFVLSDHADFPELLTAIKETGAENIYTTHGYDDIFARYLSQSGWNARTLTTASSDGPQSTGTLP